MPTTFVRLSLAAAALGTALFVFTAPSHAGTFGNGPWCAVQDLGVGDIVWDCEYMTAAQCQPQVIAGNRGSCNLNPAWPQYQPYPPAARYHRRHHRG